MTKAEELKAQAQTFEVEELEERLEFISCHWGSDRPGESGMGNCHIDF
ncbi:MAG: hypothetical protein HRT35_29685 [Algicola sp.]|nr:hypothetical protein [Algicola sp.]